MGYEVALKQSWQNLVGILEKRGESLQELSVVFLGQKYSVIPASKLVCVCDTKKVVKDWLAILILHYLVKAIEGLPELCGEWVSFRELPGGDSYYPAFSKRALEPIKKKFSSDFGLFYRCLDRFPSEQLHQADLAVKVEVFPAVPIIVEVWKPDEEFPIEVNMLFDRSISQIFCTEDVAVLAGYIAHQI